MTSWSAVAGQLTMPGSSINDKSGLALEPVCCKNQQKKSFCPVTGLWNRGPLKILNNIKLILDDQGNHKDSYTGCTSFLVP